MVMPKEVLDNTIIDRPRLEWMAALYRSVRMVPGSIAEVGVYKGGSAYLLGLLSEGRKWIYLCDTFEGMPSPMPLVDKHLAGDFSDTSETSVFELMKTFPSFSIHKGIFPKETGMYLKGPFAFVHLDCDIYRSVKDSLEFFWPLMSLGGIILMDDYGAPTCPGAKTAAAEFLMNKAKILRGAGSQAYVVKNQ